jgi:hypothetical protein
MNCPQCGIDNPEGAQFCTRCGASLSVSTTSSAGIESAELPMTEGRRQLGPDEHFCISCGQIIKKLAEICPKCGVRLRDAFDREKISGKTSPFFKITLIIGSLLLPVIGLIAGVKYLFTKNRRGFGVLLLALGTVSVIFVGPVVFQSSSDGNPGVSIVSYDCEKLKSKVLKMSKERNNPFSAIILKINDDVKETERTETQFFCEGTALTSSNAIVKIKYHMMKDADGDVFYGYKTD